MTVGYDYDRREGANTAAADWIIDEVLDQKDMRAKIHAFLRTVVREGQTVSDHFRKTLQEVERTVDHEGITITERDAIKAVYRGAVKEIFDDAMGPMLAELIATRKYVD